MRSWILSVALLLAAVPAWAQEIPARLTLDEALRIATLRNPTYLQAVNNEDVAVAQERQAWGAFLPSISADLGFGGSVSRTLKATGDFGEIRENDSFLNTTTSSARQGVSLNMTLFDGGANMNRLRQYRANSEAVAAQITAAGLKLQLDVTVAYYRALQAEQTLRVEERLVESAREQLQMTQRRFEIGSALREDVLGAEAAVASREQAVLQAGGELEKARLGILQQMGVDRVVDFQLVDGTPAAFDPAVIDEDALLDDALTRSPRVVQQQASVRAAERAASAARGSRWPRITASAGIGRSVNEQDYAAFFEVNPPNRSITFGVSASLPIFTRFETSAAIAQANAQLADAQEQARLERMAVATEVRQALVDLRNAYRAVQLADRALTLSQERLELTQERYRTGTSVSFIAYQNAIDQAAATERSAISARFNFVTALVNLEAKVGREVRP